MSGGRGAISKGKGKGGRHASGGKEANGGKDDGHEGASKGKGTKGTKGTKGSKAGKASKGGKGGKAGGGKSSQVAIDKGKSGGHRAPEVATRFTGTIKSYDEEKGFGFIYPDSKIDNLDRNLCVRHVEAL